MKRSVRFSLWLMLVTARLLSAQEAMPVFHLHLPGVKFDYPGLEHWAEIENPDGSRQWSYAIFTGRDSCTVPFQAGSAGVYRVLRIENRRGDHRVNDMIATNSELEVTVSNPRPSPSPAPVPADTVEAGEFKMIFAAAEPWCVNDHTFVQGPDHLWHLFGITHPKPLRFFEDPGRRLAHATATNLLQSPWQALPAAVTRDWEKFHEYLLWAPYVIQNHGTYYMFVCVGDQNSHRYRIHLLTSPDLKTWTRNPDNPMVVDGFDARDPFVLRVGDQWVLYYTATSTPDCGNHIVASLTSTDLVHWSNRRVVFTHPRAGSFGGPTESPFVVRRGDSYYLFVCDNEWTDVYLSRDPFHWRFEDKTTRIRSHASEIVRDSKGNWFISHAGWTEGPVCLAPLRWRDGLDGQPTNIQPAAE